MLAVNDIPAPMPPEKTTAIPCFAHRTISARTSDQYGCQSPLGPSVSKAVPQLLEMIGTFSVSRAAWNAWTVSSIARPWRRTLGATGELNQGPDRFFVGYRGARRVRVDR